ncbi:hypothetical protein APSETT444_004937 [Aspergillus pseudonomiae]
MATAKAQCSTILLQAECSEASLAVGESLMSIGKASRQLAAKLLQPPKFETMKKGEAMIDSM